MANASNCLLWKTSSSDRLSKLSRYGSFSQLRIEKYDSTEGELGNNVARLPQNVRRVANLIPRASHASLNFVPRSCWSRIVLNEGSNLYALSDMTLSKNLSCSDGYNAWYSFHFSWCCDSMCLVISQRKSGPYVWFATRAERFQFAMSTCRSKYLQNKQTAYRTTDVLTSRFVTCSPSFCL